MKHLQLRLLIGTFIFLLAFGYTYMHPSTVQAAENETTETSNLDNWLDICQTMGENLHKKKFKYSNSHTASSYKAALSSGRKRANCSLYVSWCLQEYGATKTGQTFYSRGNGSIHKNFKKWGSNIKVIRTYKRTSSAKLQPGDIVSWKGTAHMCIYAGKNSKGERLWYDGGKVATYGNHSGSRYKKFTARHLGYLDSRKIAYIIRIKDL